MTMKALLRGLKLLTLLLVLKASTYGDALGLNNVGTVFNSDSSAVFITPGLDPSFPETSPGSAGLSTDKHDYILGLDGFFTSGASTVTQIQYGPSGTGSLGEVSNNGTPWGYASSVPDGIVNPNLNLAGISSLGAVMIPNPEPSSLLLLGSGLAGLAYILRKRRVPNKKNSHMKAAISTSLLFLVFSAGGYSQGLSTYHVFPQVPDGRLTDGTFYRSTVFATNTNGASVSCTYQLYGLSSDRLPQGNSYTVSPQGGVLRASTSGNVFAFGSGYATLSCDQSVQSYIQYEYVSPDRGVLGLATVFSSPGTTAAEFIFPLATGYRLGLAIANNTDSAAQYSIRLGAVGSRELDRSITIAARSNVAQFVDELFVIPQDFVPVAVLVESSSSSSAGPEFSAMGLVFWGNAFSTAPSLIYGF